MYVSNFLITLGYDDERGDLIVVEHDHLAYKYEILGILGKGSFGQVLKCFDHKSKTMRAVKVIPNRTRFQRQAMVEVKILRYLHEKVLLHSFSYVDLFSSKVSSRN